MGRCQWETPQISCSTESGSKLSVFAFILKSEYLQGYTTKKKKNMCENAGFCSILNVFN